MFFLGGNWEMVIVPMHELISGKYVLPYSVIELLIFQYTTELVKLYLCLLYSTD